jgi:hypothetical protein
MKSWVVAAGLLAAAVCTGAKAADLDEGPPADQRSGSAYDDPRYAEMYRYPDPAPRYREPRPYDERYAAPPIPRERVYRDEEDEREGYRDPRRYSRADPYPYARPPYASPYGPSYGPSASRCLPREQIRQHLLHHGWAELVDTELRGGLAVVHARRPSGRQFALTIDRCTGEVVDARPLFEGPVRGPYAYDAPPRWSRPF